MRHIRHKIGLCTVCILCLQYKFFHQTVLLHDLCDINNRQHISLYEIICFQCSLLNLIMPVIPVKKTLAAFQKFVNFPIPAIAATLFNIGDKIFSHRV